jgi:hypothetical protein
MTHPETGRDDSLPERFTFVGSSPRNGAPMDDRTRVTARGFVEIGSDSQDGSDEYIQDLVKMEAANGRLFIDGVYPDADDINEEMAYQLIRAQADEGFVEIEGWEVVVQDSQSDSSDELRVNVACFADLPTEAIVDDPSFDDAASKLSARSLLSPREAELSILRNRGLNHREAAAVMGVTKGTTDKLSQRIDEKRRKAEATLEHVRGPQDEPHLS